LHEFNKITNCKSN